MYLFPKQISQMSIIKLLPGIILRHIRKIFFLGVRPLWIRSRDPIGAVFIGKTLKKAPLFFLKKKKKKKKKMAKSAKFFLSLSLSLFFFCEKKKRNSFFVKIT